MVVGSALRQPSETPAERAKAGHRRPWCAVAKHTANNAERIGQNGLFYLATGPIRR
jgi:hypothetical protein